MLTEGRQDVEIGALGDFPLDDAEEDHDKAARVAKPVAEETHDFCRPMRIQYWNPWEDEPVNEAAYVDPQDEWDGGSGALLVSINALNALKNRSALQYRYHEETLLSVERCRRDYLREQQYLLDELARLEHDADFQTAQEIRRQVDTASIAREIAATNPVRVLGSVEDVHSLACGVGPRSASDKELEEQLHRHGLSTDDELTTRLLLRELREKTRANLMERDRLYKIYAPLEGLERTNVAESMMSAIDEEKVPLEDALYVMRDMERTEHGRNAINDAVTDNIRFKYDKTLQEEQKMESEIMKSREKLALEEILAGRSHTLREEIVKEREHQEEQAAKHARRWEEFEAEQERLMKKELESSMTQDDPLVLQEARVRQIQEENAEMEKHVHDMEEKVAKDQAERDSLRQRIAEAQHVIDNVGSLESVAYRKYKAAETECERWQAEHQAEKALAAALSDEYNASLMPPPNMKELYKLEHEIEDARLKTAEFRSEEASVKAQEQHYRRKVERAQEAWEHEEELMRAAEERRKEEVSAERKAMMAGRKRQIRIYDDPHMMHYRDRHEHPEFVNRDRFDMLHDNAVARHKKTMARVTVHQSKVSDRYFAAQRARTPDLFLGPVDDDVDMEAEMSTIGFQGAAADGNVVPAHVAPLTFRRPEDLKVRRLGYQQSAKATTERLHAYQAEAGAAAADLSEVQQRIRVSIDKTLSAQRDLNGTLQRAATATPPDDAPGSFQTLRRALATALTEHEACVESAAEAWRKTEDFCAECGDLPSFETLLRATAEEQFSNQEDQTLSTASSRVYRSASKVLEEDAAATHANAGTSVAPARLVGWARQCCTSYQATDLVLVSSKSLRQSAWSGLGALAKNLMQNMEVQESLELLREEQEQNLELLEQELQAPPEQRRALATARALMRQQDSFAVPRAVSQQLPRSTSDLPEVVFGTSVALKEKRVLANK
mmetsp:Transcript_58836/g.137414  ORF Transcript_58836/g.137414 Transcript_58836/m.137414 type:complete len:953 (+) Transcript_58836:115-2973(+)